MYIMYIVPGPAVCIYCVATHLSTASIGDPKVPFYAALPGILLSTSSQEQERVTLFRTQGPLCQLLYIFTHDHHVASNPQSQSRRLLSSCIVLLVLAYF